MTNFRAPGLSPGDFLRALSRHLRKAFLVFFFVMLATVAWIFFAPKEYQSTAKVYVRVGHESITLDPSATTGQTVNIEQTLEAEINSMLEISSSRETAEIVAAKVGVDAILANDSVNVGTDETKAEESVFHKLKSWLKSTKSKIFAERFAETREQRAVRSLLKNSSIWSPKNSNVIEITYRAGHPELAQEVARAWTDAFIQEHLRVAHTEGSFYFFSRQTDELQNRLLEAEAELREAKSASGLVSVEGQRQVLEDQAKSIRTRALTNRSLLVASKAKLDELKTILDTVPARVNADQRTQEFHEGWNGLREKLFELQIREFELKSKYSESNPEVIAVERQRKEVERILAAQSQSSSESIEGPNPTYQMFQQSLLNEQATTAFLIAEQSSLKAQLLENQAEIKKLNENAVLISDLDRHLQVLDTAYRESAARMEQARTLQAMETASISSLSRLQAASLDPRPVGLGRLKTLLVGIVLGLMAGGGVAFVFEYFDRSFFSASQVERSLDLPVLVSIPHSRRQFVEVN